MLTLQQVTAGIEKAFAPDLSFEYDDFWKAYLVKSESELGKQYLSQNCYTRGFGRMIQPGGIESHYDKALKSGLTCQRIDNE